MSEMERLREVAEESQIEWREQVGIRLMRAMKCTHHGTDDFGPRAVCVTCFENTQRIGALVERIAAHAWDQGRAAERRDWELTADLATPDEDRQPLTNPYRALSTPQPADAPEGHGDADEAGEGL